MDVELAHEMLPMFIHRFKADTQFRSDEFVGLAFGDELQHLHLARTETVVFLFGIPAPPPLSASAITYVFGDGRAVEFVPILDFADRRGKNVGRSLFEQKPSRTQRCDLLDVGVVAVRGENEHLGVGKVYANLPGGFQAIEQRHRDVHYNYRRPKFPGQLDGLSASLSFANHFNVGFVFQ